MAPKRSRPKPKERRKQTGVKPRSSTTRPGSSSPPGAVRVSPKVRERESSPPGAVRVSQEVREREVEVPDEEEEVHDEEEEMPDQEEESTENQQIATPNKEELALEEGRVSELVAHSPSSGWSGSFASIVKQGKVIDQLRKPTADDIKKAALFARRALLHPDVAPRKNNTPSWANRRTQVGQRPRPSVPKEKSVEQRKAEAELIAQRVRAQSVSRLNAEEAKARKAEEALLSNAMDFMSSFRKRGEETLRCSMCSGKVASMRKKGGTVLKIDFEYLLIKKYKNLAIKVAKETDRRYMWLKPALVKFLMDQGMTETEAQNIEISFKNCPSSIQSVGEFMQSKEKIARDVRLLHGERTVYAAAMLGRVGIPAHVEAFFSKHDEDITYSGIFTLDDLLILNEERVVILADPVLPTKTEANSFGHTLPEDKCKDMAQIWKLLSPFYTRKGADGRDELPLHFEDLRNELLGVQPAEVTTEAFRELIRCCFALASCMARAIFSKNVYRITKRFGTGADPAVEDAFLYLLHGSLVEWKTDSKGSSVSAIKGVANYKDTISKLPDNAFGCLGQGRHVLEHGAEYSQLDDLDEIELLTSDEYEELPHNILKALIYRSDPFGRYASILSAYKATAKNDQHDLPRGS